ncbi:hypothetical protein I314_04030 [Cryptococcus bacillisporus CA1873]|uniref:Uncharacterized protein n=2 Tax=Cryptococcus gattii TaxID=552467 RepID=A0A0D0TKF2_CRYGA|nr:hypothetical protein I312_03847 [Cryptococcus bacillisporus CA1280]KIR60175.1 hypothetical protein I314_04030 [Cryptococcus bacillisporus CA1873]|eukprot:KIR60175.1 hypothetical protein I314_04030 [Cryptococcus gattii CA1873]
MSLRALTYSYSFLHKPFALSSVRGLASKAADVPPLPPFNVETAYKLVVSTYPLYQKSFPYIPSLHPNFDLAQSR